MWSIVVVSFVLVVTVSGQRPFRTPEDLKGPHVDAQLVPELASACPSPNGFFADAYQCDKYYECVDDVITEKLCADGLAFVDLNAKIEKCDYINVVDCSGRPELQPPKATDVCPRQNGYFSHEDPTVCDKFYFCNAGTENRLTCPESLVFSLKTNNCVWADTANRTGCSAQSLLEFDCPKVPHNIAVSHPRYADPLDCQFFFVCLNGNSPRRNGCNLGQVFSSSLSACTSPLDVPECANYYVEYFDNYFKTLETSNGHVSADILAAAITSGYDVPELKKRIDLSAGAGARRPSKARGSTPAPPRAPAAPTRPLVSQPRQEAAVLSPSRPRSPSRPVSPTRHRFGTQPKPTATTPPPPPTPVEEAAYDYPADYTDPAYYDYPAEVAEPAAPPPATTPAPAQAPRKPVIRRRVPLRNLRPTQ